jgi:hypothetical protein
MGLDIQQINLYNPGVIKTKLTDQDFNLIKESLYKQIGDTDNIIQYNRHLSGHIEKEYQLNLEDFFKAILSDMFSEYQRRYDFYPERKFTVGNTAWVNVQRKHEFNPVHLHDGIAAWVLWIKIPYDLQTELKLPLAVNSYSARTSLFEFIYSRLDSGTSIQNLFVDRSWEGTLMMFPAYLKHCVYPFYTSDDYRISIASNVRFVS